MIKRPGYNKVTNEYGNVIEEMDTRGCVHCQRIVFIPPRSNPSDHHGWCYSCNGVLCIRCGTAQQQGVACMHWERALNRGMARQQLFIDLGLL